MNGPLFCKNEIPITQLLLCASLDEDFKMLSMYFRYLNIIFPWQGAGTFIWTNLNPLYKRMLCAKSDCGFNWPSHSGKADFQMSSMYFRYFDIIFLWKRDWSFIWTTFALCQAFSNVNIHVFRYFLLFLLWKGRGPSS